MKTENSYASHKESENICNQWQTDHSCECKDNRKKVTSCTWLKQSQIKTMFLNIRNSYTSFTKEFKNILPGTKIWHNRKARE